MNVLLAESVWVSTLSESVCDNVWESKADTLCRPACAQALVLVYPFSKISSTSSLQLKSTEATQLLSFPFSLSRFPQSSRHWVRNVVWLSMIKAGWFQVPDGRERCVNIVDVVLLAVHSVADDLKKKRNSWEAREWRLSRQRRSEWSRSRLSRPFWTARTLTGQRRCLKAIWSSHLSVSWKLSRLRSQWGWLRIEKRWEISLTQIFQEQNVSHQNKENKTGFKQLWSRL